VLAILACSGVAAAEGEQVTVSWSPIHLVLPVIEVAGEYNAIRRLQAADEPRLRVHRSARRFVPGGARRELDADGQWGAVRRAPQPERRLVVL